MENQDLFICIDHVGLAVPDLDDEESRESVEVAASAIVEDACPLASRDHRWRDLVAVTGEVSPQVRSASLPEGFGYGCGHRVPQLYCCFTSFR